MENLIKRYFWVANLVVLATIAYLSARVVNNVLAGAIAALPTHPPADAEGAAERAAAARAAPSANTQDWAQAITDRNLFNSEPVAPDTGDAGPAEPQLPDHVPDERDPNCKKSDGRLGLLATMVAVPRDWSMAVINDGESPDSRLVKEGQAVGDYTISAIYRERMVVARGGQYECVDLGQAGQKGAGPVGGATYNPPAPLPPGDPDDSSKDGVTKTGENSYKMSRADLNSKLENMEELARQARVIPHYRDGKPQGFKLVGVRPGSLYSHLGIRSGDVLKSVNDEEISSPNKALEMYEKLKNGSKFSVEIERRGRPVTLTLDIE